MAILKHIASKSSDYGAALEYLIFKHDELRKTPILDQNGNRIMRDEFYLDGLNCEPYSFDAACQQLNREYQKNKNKDEIKSHGCSRWVMASKFSVRIFNLSWGGGKV